VDAADLRVLALQVGDDRQRRVVGLVVDDEDLVRLGAPTASAASVARAFSPSR
jgi:hypothetical protein